MQRTNAPVKVVRALVGICGIETGPGAATWVPGLLLLGPASLRLLLANFVDSSWNLRRRLPYPLHLIWRRSQREHGGFDATTHYVHMVKCRPLSGEKDHGATFFFCSRQLLHPRLLGTPTMLGSGREIVGRRKQKELDCGIQAYSNRGGCEAEK